MVFLNQVDERKRAIGFLIAKGFVEDQVGHSLVLTARGQLFEQELHSLLDKRSGTRNPTDHNQKSEKVPSLE